MDYQKVVFEQLLQNRIFMKNLSLKDLYLYKRCIKTWIKYKKRGL